MRTGRRAAGVLAGLVLGGATMGIGVAHADGIVWGCPSDYTLDGTTCRGADGSTVDALGLLPGDVDPATGTVLLSGASDPDPTTAPPVPTDAPAPPASTTAPTPPSTAAPAPPSTAMPPAVLPCPRPVTPPAAGNDVVRTAAAVDAARARLTTDARRGAPPAVLRADAQGLAAAIREHTTALLAQRSPGVCPTR